MLVNKSSPRDRRERAAGSDSHAARIASPGRTLPRRVAAGCTCDGLCECCCHFTQHLDDTFRVVLLSLARQHSVRYTRAHCVEPQKKNLCSSPLFRLGVSVWFASHRRIHSSQTLSACAGAHNGSTGSAIRSSLAPLLPVVGAGYVAVLSPPLTNRAVPLLAPLRRRQTEARDLPASASPFFRLEQRRCR